MVRRAKKARKQRSGGREERRGRETVAGVKSLELSELFALYHSCDFECLLVSNRLL